MADDADQAAKLQAATNASAAAQRRPVPQIKPEGWCHCCGNDIAEGALFCPAGRARMNLSALRGREGDNG